MPELKKYLVGVTDGSAFCRTTVISFVSDDDAETFIKEGYARDGARPFWIACEDTASIYSFQRLCRARDITGYLLDGAVWAKYTKEHGKYTWLEL